MTVKVIAIDIDGTLLDDHKDISLANKEAIELAHRQGITIVLCTGRPIQGVKKVIDQLDISFELSYQIAYNGSLIYDNLTGETIVECGLSRDAAHKIVELTESYDVGIHGFTKEGIISFKPDVHMFTVRESYMSNAPLKYCSLSQLSEEELFHKFMIVAEPEKLKKFHSEMHSKVAVNFDCYFSEAHYLEIMPKGVNKGTGLNHLLEKLHLSPANLLAIGDNNNDLEMIRLASIGVAMRNATTELKELSDYVTESNNQAGVASAIRKFIN